MERRVWVGWAVAVALSVGHMATDEFVVHGPDLLTEHPAARVSTDPDCSPCRSVTSVRLRLPRGAGWVLEGTADLVAAERARLFVLATAHDGEQRWFGSRRATVGSSELRVVVPPEVGDWDVEVGAIVEGAGSELHATGLTLREAPTNPVHLLLWGSAAVAWSLVAAGTIALIRRSSVARVQLALVVFAGMAALAVVLPRGWMDLAAMALTGQQATWSVVLQKGGGHLGGFAVLAGLGVVGGGGGSVVFLRVMGFAIATEMLQGLTPDRTPRWTDLGIDAVGAALGLALGLSLFRGARRAPPGSAASPP